MSSSKGRRTPLTLDEFLRQLQELRKIGPITKLLKMLPGSLGEMAGGIDENEVRNIEAILLAMTLEERNNPDLLLDEPRRSRIAISAGRPVEEVNSLIAQFYQARRLDSGDAPTLA